MRIGNFRRLAMTAAAAVLSLSLAPARATVLNAENTLVPSNVEPCYDLYRGSGLC